MRHRPQREAPICSCPVAGPATCFLTQCHSLEASFKPSPLEHPTLGPICLHVQNEVPQVAGVVTLPGQSSQPFRDRQMDSSLPRTPKPCCRSPGERTGGSAPQVCPRGLRPAPRGLQKAGGWHHEGKAPVGVPEEGCSSRTRTHTLRGK